MFRPSFFFLFSVVCAMALASSSAFRIYGLNYGTKLINNQCKPEDQIKKELSEVAKIADRIRIYALGECDNGILLPKLAKEAGLKLWLGMWTCKFEACFDENYKYLEKMMDNGIFETYKDTIVGMHVGSEAIYREEVTATKAIEYLTTVREYLKSNDVSITLTIADIVDTYLSYPDLIEAVDIVSANIFTFWEKTPIEGSDARLRERLGALENAAKPRGKKFLISETGWSEKGENDAASTASLENSVEYFRIFTSMARESAHQWEYYYFSAIDEPWKKWSADGVDPDKSVEPWFGLLDENANLKEGFSQVLTDEGSTDPTPSPSNGNTTTTPTPTTDPDTTTLPTATPSSSSDSDDTTSPTPIPSQSSDADTTTSPTSAPTPTPDVNSAHSTTRSAVITAGFVALAALL